MLQDLNYALRSLRDHPGFAVVAVLTLALGIGATSTIFSAVNAVLLRDLPVRDPGRLVRLFHHRPTAAGLDNRFSYPDYRDYRDEIRTLDALVGVDPFQVAVSIGGTSELVDGELVTANYFAGLGVTPSIGRAFLPEEEREPGAHSVVVLSHALWRRLTRGDSGAVGRTARLNNRDYTIVGVAPEGFGGTNFALERDVWVPIMMRERFIGRAGSADASAMRRDSWTRDRRAAVMTLFGRLAGGSSRADAEVDLNRVAGQLGRSHPATHGDLSLRVLPERAGLINPESPRLVAVAGLMAVGVVGLVLLVACANVAGLLLARAVLRRREIAVRVAMGADRRRLVRQLLTESAVLSIPAGVLGLLFAFWSTPVYTAFLPSGGGPVVSFAPDQRVVLFTLVVTLLTTLLFGLTPAIQSTRGDTLASLKAEGGRTGSSAPGTPRLLNGIVGVQLALSVVVLVAAGLLVRTMLWQQAVDPGFSPERRLTVRLDLRVHEYPPSAGVEFFDRLVTGVRASPGVVGATIASPGAFGLPLSMETWLPGGEGSSDSIGVPVAYAVVGTDYFRTLAIPLLSGRDFTAGDREDAPPVIIVNATMAQRFWPNADPVGQRIRLAETSVPTTVIGVAADAKYTALAERARPFMYLPFTQRYRAAASVIVWTSGDPRAAVPVVRREVQALDRTLPIAGQMTLEDQVRSDLALARTAALLAGTMGMLVLFLAAVGLYGVLAFVIRRRRREIGIRIALGARGADVVRMVVRQGMTPVALAVAAGLAVALTVTGLARGLFLEISPRDPLTFGTVIVVLVGVALIATYLPARKAAGVRPMEALRNE